MNAKERLLSEIAEEDHVSMMSDAPHKFKKQTDVLQTPIDKSSEIKVLDRTGAQPIFKTNTRATPNK